MDDLEPVDPLPYYAHKVRDGKYSIDHAVTAITTLVGFPREQCREWLLNELAHINEEKANVEAS